MLPARGLWPHPYYDVPDAYVEVAFADAQGELRIRSGAGTRFPCPVRILYYYARKDVMVPASFGPLFHADIPGSELVWMDDASHFLQIEAPERTVEQIMSFGAAKG
jgi:pimeloyl-ACP methyl ester carboxylesterase